MHACNSFWRAVRWVCFCRFSLRFGGKVKTFLPNDKIIFGK